MSYEHWKATEPAVSGPVPASIRRTLAHRGGTNGEDLYAIDPAIGKTITSCVNSNIGSAVEPPVRFGRKVAAAIEDGRRVALLHSHPASGIPSAAVLVSVANKGCEFGIIAAHDGSISAFERLPSQTRFIMRPKTTWTRPAISATVTRGCTARFGKDWFRK